MSALRDRTVVVIDGSSGIGLEVARRAKVGRESEIADAVLYLLGATFTTGSTIYPDGGYSLR